MTDCLINELINTKNEYNRLLEEMEKKEDEKKKKEEEIRKKEKKIKSSLRLYHKGNYNKVNVIDNEMNDEQKNFAIDITRKSLNMHKDDHCECVNYIKDQFVNKYGGCWCVFIRPQNYGNSISYYCDNCYICFTMGEFSIVIFKSSK